MTQRLQANRFEFKYLVDEPQARGIRDFLRGHMEVDEYAQGRADASYAIYSLYLDSPTLVLYRQTTHGLKNRFKLRIRFYDGVPEHPAFLEIKRRVSDVILKERAAVTRDGVRQMLQGKRPADSQLVASKGNRQAEGALDRFCGLCERLGAQPAAYVSYVREAYVSPDSDQLRVTFDRHIGGSAFHERLGLAPPLGGVAANMEGLVLEIKFMDRFPKWLRELVWAFNLQRRAASKYIHCVEALGLHPARWLHPAGAEWPDPWDTAMSWADGSRETGAVCAGCREVVQ